MSQNKSLNKDVFDFLGITRWHELGYTGKGITICSKEDVLKGVFDDVICNDPFTTKSDNAKHGTLVMDYIRQVAPDAKKIATGLSGTVSKNEWKCNDLDMLLKNPPHIMVSSNYDGNDHSEIKMTKYRELKDKGCFLISGAGNDGKDGVLEMVKNDVFKAVGACRYKNGAIIKSDASSEGVELDWMCFDNLYATWDRKKHQGTSFSNPVSGAMLCNVQQFFNDNYREVLTEEALTRFVLDNCIDLEGLGFDIKTGYGLFRLPEPTTLNPYRYIKKFKGYELWNEAIDFLVEKGDMDSPQKWRSEITKKHNIDQMWFCCKWANAVAGRELII